MGSQIAGHQSIVYWDAFIKALLEHPSFSEVFAPLIVGGVLAFLGLRPFFRRKAYELVQKRYLDDTLDLLVDDFGATLANHRANWYDGIWLLTSLKNDLANECNVELGMRQRPGSFNTAIVQRLERLVGDDEHSLSWMTQKLYAHVDKANAFLYHDLVPGVKAAQQRLNEQAPAAVRDKTQLAVSKYESRLKLLSEEWIPYERFLAHLGELAGILEQQKFTLRMIRRFRQNSQVRRWLAQLNEQRVALEKLS